MSNKKIKIGGLISILISAIMFVSTAMAAGGGGSWLTSGQNLQNTRYQSSESKINVNNVSNLSVKWQFTTGGNVSATPAVDGTTVYFPDWAGNLYAVDENTGTLVWQHKISDYTGVPGDFARDTPAVVGNMLILGDQGGYLTVPAPSGAKVFAVNKQNGNPIWVTQVESHLFSIITQSPIVDYNDYFKANVAYIGVSSIEEGVAALIPGYSCCSFRGSMLALNASTGQILWKTYTIPEGYSGGAVWGSTGAIDHSRGSLFIDSGNNYSVPADVLSCVGNASTPDEQKACLSPDDHFDSILALDYNTGAIKWALNAVPYDAWNVDCLPFFGGGNCPQPSGPDYDFGQGPALFTIKNPATGKNRDLVGAGEKSGQYWALDASTGAVVWRTQAGPGGVNGGLQWGSATDGSRIYVANTNSLATPWNLVQNGVPSNVQVTSGFWSALDATTGQILWQTADPLGAQDPGAVSAANGVVYGCSFDPAGHMYAFNGATGAILWSFASGGSCNAGAADVNGMVFWGSGYPVFLSGNPNNQFYAFSLK